MFWTLELASYLEEAPWPATKDELIDYSIRSGPRAFELDHCLPVSSHPELALEPSNFKPAHAVCNRRRQAAAVEGVAVQSLIGS